MGETYFQHSAILTAFASLINLDPTAKLVHLRNIVKEGHSSQQNTVIKPGLTVQEDGIITAYAEDTRTLIMLNVGDALYLTTTTEDALKLNSEMIFIYRGEDKFDALAPTFAQYEFNDQTHEFSKPTENPSEDLPFTNPHEVLDGLSRVATQEAKNLKDGEHLRLLAITEDYLSLPVEEEKQKLIALAKRDGFYTGIEVAVNYEAAVLTSDRGPLNITPGLFMYFVIFSDEADFSDLRCVKRVSRTDGDLRVLDRWESINGKPEVFPSESHAKKYVESLDEPERATEGNPDIFKAAEEHLDSVQIHRHLDEILVSIRRTIPRSTRVGIVIDKTNRSLHDIVEDVINDAVGQQYQCIEFNAVHKVAMLVHYEREGSTSDFRRIKVDNNSHIFFVTDKAGSDGKLEILRHAVVLNGTLRRAVKSPYQSPAASYVPFVSESDAIKALTQADLAEAFQRDDWMPSATTQFRDATPEEVTAAGMDKSNFANIPAHWKSEETTDVATQLNKALDELVKPPIGPSDSELLDLSGFGSPEVS